MPALSKPTNGTNADYANRIGLLFDAFNNGNYNFPATQVPSADANTLDDYEEGSWTPAMKFGGASVSLTYSSQAGTYTKIGQRVFISSYMAMSAKGSSTGNATVSGLPFAVTGTAGSRGIANIRLVTVTYTGMYTATLDQGAVVASLEQIVEAGTLSNLTHTNFANTSEIIMSGQYPTS